MDDADIIAYLCPVKGEGRGGAEEAMRLNPSRLIPSQRPEHLTGLPHDNDSHLSRAPTEDLDDESDYSDDSRIVLRFSQPPKSPRGFIAGKESASRHRFS